MNVVTLTKWGNSVGIRLPSSELKAANAYIGEQFELSVNNKGGFVLQPIKNPQAGWTEAFNAAADAKSDAQLIPHIETDFDKDEWTWE